MGSCRSTNSITSGAWNAAKFANPEYDRLVGAYTRALDVGAQRSVAGQIQRLLLDETPVIISYFPNLLVPVRKGVTGVPPIAAGLLLGGASKAAAEAREARVLADVRRAAASYPAPHREALLRATKGRGVDPRFMLAVTRQESGFRADAKSPAGARGLMQLVPDVAAKYAPAAKLTNLREDDLYRPEVNITLAGVYLEELFKMFPGLPEAVAASYNGGEDSVVRWVRRAVHDDPGVFTAEVGFVETKDYVHKVMANYRAYCLLYTEDLRPRK